jgi:hypothetical protein
MLGRKTSQIKSTLSWLHTFSSMHPMPGTQATLKQIKSLGSYCTEDEKASVISLAQSGYPRKAVLGVFDLARGSLEDGSAGASYFQLRLLSLSFRVPLG